MLDFLSSNNDAFTSIGVILTFLIAIITLFVTRKNNKIITFTNTVTKSKIDRLEKLQALVSQYASLAKINFYSSTKSVSDNTYFQKILELSIEIKLSLGTCDDAEEITSLINDINQSYETLICTYNCMEACGEKLFSHVLNENICTNPFFIKYLFICAREKGVQVEPAAKYVGDVNRVINLVTEINQTPEDMDMFLERLIERPEYIILQLNDDLERLVLTTIRYVEVTKRSLEKEIKNMRI